MGQSCGEFYWTTGDEGDRVFCVDGGVDYTCVCVSD